MVVYRLLNGNCARIVIALFAAVCSVAIFARPSFSVAHQGDPNYRSELEGVRPSALAEGLDFSVGNYDDFVALSNRSGKTVVIEGYGGEPYLRFRPDGLVSVNTRSPAWFANRDRFGEEAVPESADPNAPPRWKRLGDEGRYAWHDHRSHWMGKGLPPQVGDRAVRTKVFGYSIPIEVGGRPAELAGTLYWAGSGGSPSIWPFLVLGAVVVIGGCALLIVRRRRSGEARRSREVSS